MSQNDTDKKFDPILLKNKAEENDVSLELNRISRILEERLVLLNKTTGSLNSKNEELIRLKEMVHTKGFISGDTTVISRIEQTKARLLVELHELKDREHEYQELVNRAQDKLQMLQEQLGFIYNSRKAVEKLKDFRQNMHAAVDDLQEDYHIEELLSYKRDRDE